MTSAPAPAGPLPEQPRLLPGTAVARRDAQHVQVGLDARAAVLPDTPEVRRVLGALQEGSPLAADVRDAPGAALALDRLHTAGLLVDGPTLRTSLASYAAGPVERPALAATWCADPAGAAARWAVRRQAVVAVDGPSPDRVTVERLLATAGVPTCTGPPDVVLVLREGQPARCELDALTQQDRPHLLVHGELDHVVLGPFVAPGRTACLRCLDAHLADVDPRRPLVLEQQADVTAPAPLDPVLWQLALAWAVRDVLRWVDGERPSTWSATVRLGPDPSPQRREWLRHPRCGCGWAELAAHQCSGASLPSIERRCSREQVSQ
ncbi:MAG: TOMM precursor leader peptide-binding protein [Nocardioides sp.]